jgi:CRISPR system Cascade subunit CasC
MRTSQVFADKVAGAIGVRSVDFAAPLVRALQRRGLEAAQATALVEAVMEHDRMGKVRRGRAQTEQLVHLGPDEQGRLEALADRLAGGLGLDGTQPLVLQPRPRAADIAMFGRMLADNPQFNVEAAVQVAHAFTTHRAIVDDDYFTAVDDFARAGQASFMGMAQFGAGVFYQYICVDTGLLRDNLSGDGDLCAAALEGLIAAALTVPPTGRQSSFAHRVKASYALLEIGEETPRSLASAFLHPVGELEGEDQQLPASLQRLRSLRNAFEASYGERFQTVAEFGPLVPDGPPLDAFVGHARSLFDSSAAGR